MYTYRKKASERHQVNSRSVFILSILDTKEGDSDPDVRNRLYEQKSDAYDAMLNIAGNYLKEGFKVTEMGKQEIELSHPKNGNHYVQMTIEFSVVNR